jgi:hypothetical protein
VRPANGIDARVTVARRVLIGLAIVVSASLLSGCQHLATYRSTALGCTFKYPKEFNLQSELPTKQSVVATFGEVRSEGGTVATDATFSVTKYDRAGYGPYLATNIASYKASWRKTLGSSFVRFTRAVPVTAGSLRGVVLTIVDHPSGPTQQWVDETWVLSGSRTYVVWLRAPASDWPTIGPQLRNVALTIKPLS